MPFRAQLHITQDADRRRSTRTPASSRRTLATDQGGSLAILIRDLSLHGFRAEIGCDLAIGAVVSLSLAGPNPFPATVVWRDGQEYGCEFVVPISAVAVADAFSGRDVIEW